MTDEQIAYEFVRQVSILSSDGVAVTTLTAIIAEARSTERERCAEIGRMECVCRECYGIPTRQKRRSYCASCGRPLAWPVGTVPLSRPEALKKAWSDERKRCAAIVERYTDDSQPGVVQVAAREISIAILEE